MVGGASKQCLHTYPKPVTLLFILLTAKEGKMRFGRTLVSFIRVNRDAVKWGTVVNTRTRRAAVTDCFYSPRI